MKPGNRRNWIANCRPKTDIVVTCPAYRKIREQTAAEMYIDSDMPVAEINRCWLASGAYVTDLARRLGLPLRSHGGFRRPSRKI